MTLLFLKLSFSNTCVGNNGRNTIMLWLIRFSIPKYFLVFNSYPGIILFLHTGEREGGRGGYGGDRFGDKKIGPGGDFNPEFQRVSMAISVENCLELMMTFLKRSLYTASSSFTCRDKRGTLNAM